MLSVNPNGITGPAFAIGSSTATSFLVTNGGGAAFGTTTAAAFARVSVDANLTNQTGIQIATNNADFLEFVNKGSSDKAWSIYPSGNDLRFWEFGSTVGTGGNDRFTIRSGGNVGIGTTTPWAQLSINPNGITGPAFVIGSSTATTFVVGNNGNIGVGQQPTTYTRMSISGGLSVGGGDYIGWGPDASYGAFLVAGFDMYATLASNGAYHYKMGGIERQTLTSAGYFGLASTSPWAQLSVMAGGDYTSQAASTVFAIGSSTAGTATTTHFMVNSAGSVGVGTTSPWAQLSINPNGITGPAFVIGSSTATNFVVTNGGKVGIGNNNPSYQLHLTSPDSNVAAFESTAGSAVVILNNTTASNQSLFSLADQGTVMWQIGKNTDNSFFVWDNANSRNVLNVSGSNMALMPTVGNVGIGTSTPWAQLSINPNGITGPAFAIGSSTATKFVVTNGGNVGIGTSNPSALLELSRTAAGAVGPTLQLSNDAGAGNDQADINFSDQTLIRTRISFFSQSGTGQGFMTFNTGNTNNGPLTEVMRLSPTYTVGIGTTTPFYNLTIASTTAPQLALSAGGGIAQWTFRNAGGDLFLSTTTVAGTATTSTAALTISGSGGNVGIGTTTPWAQLSINPNGITGPAFVIGSSTATNFVVTNGGTVAIKTANPDTSYSLHVGSGNVAVGSGNIIFGTSGTGIQIVGSESILFTNTNGPSRIALKSAPGELLSVTTNGTVGIATTTPFYLLTAASSTAPQLSLSAGAGIAQWAFRNAGGNLYISTTTVAGTATTSTSALSILGSNGRVGIGGIDTPTGTLEIANNTSGVELQFSGAAGANIYQSASNQDMYINANGGNLYLGANGSGSQHISVKSTGFTGIGTTTPWGLLSVNPNALAAGTPFFSVGSSTAANFLVDSNGNVGVGTTSPFARLSVFLSTTTTGTFNNTAFAIGSSTAAFATSTLFSVSNQGLVGLGTTSPWATLAVNPVAGAASNQFVVGSSTQTSFVINNSNKIGIGTTTPWGLLSVNPNALAAGTPFFSVGSSTAANFLVDSNGNVGVGTTSPYARFAIQVSTTTTGNFNNTIFAISSSTAAFSTSTLLMVNNVGNVGLGTTTPYSMINSTFSQIIDMTTTGIGGLALHNGNSSEFSLVGNSSGYFMDIAGNSTAANNFLAFRTSNTASNYTITERMRLTSAGKFGIGTTSPATILTVQGSVSGATSSALTNFIGTFVNTANATNGNVLAVSGGSNTTAGAAMVSFYRPDGTSIGGIRQSGAATVSYDTGSDRRIKENFATSTISLADLLKIDILDFSYRADPSHARATGFIAQNLEEIFPNAVSTNGDDGISPLAATATPWAVDYGRVTPLIVKAIQDLNGFIFGVSTSTNITLSTTTLSQIVGATTTSLEARVQHVASVLDTIASTSATTTTATGEKTFLGRMFDRIAQWFADASNGIQKFFVGELHTKKLCVADESGAETCLTKAQLDALISGTAGASQGGGGNGGGNGGGGGGSGAGTTTPSTGSGQTDTVAPTITLSGNNPATVTVGDTYVDLGATVSDDVDQNLGFTVSLDGAATTTLDQLVVDTSATTTHTILFSATDAAGNVGTAQRTVEVVQP
jgi:hypothetical protein